MGRYAPLRTLFLSSSKRLFASGATTLYRAGSGSNALPFAVQYLMKSCGLPLDSALSAASKLRELGRDDTEKPDSVISYLRSCGFNKTHIAALVGKQPIVLSMNVDRILKPKIQFLSEIGLPRDLVVNVIIRNPQVMSRSLDAHIKPRCELLLEYCKDADTLAAALWRCSQLLVHVDNGRFGRNVECLIESGMPKDKISRLIGMQPRVLLHSSDWMVWVTKFVKGLGFDPKALMFGHAVCVMASMTEATWRKRIDIFKSIGWSEEEVFVMFRRQPYCLASSKDKLLRVVDFFVNTVEIELKALVGRPHLLLYGIDKRLRPRYKVIKALASKNLLSEKKNVLTLFALGEKKFVKNYIAKYKDDVPGLMDMYLGVDAMKKGK
ncbi:hypothetical protein MLD38_015299 [Melastoma candidum]|uniref:Uncharacterized protein n=1 Tax=Melastoma candidum TaxID=119954 RepID=A0ACB9RFR0_9MYRT|nr:hypothetical protein MLD38_015299 [Melastoma candidum]